jgi:hypothetical protein
MSASGHSRRVMLQFSQLQGLEQVCYDCTTFAILLHCISIKVRFGFLICKYNFHHVKQ